MRYSGTEIMLVNNEGNGNEGREIIMLTSLAYTDVRAESGISDVSHVSVRQTKS